MTKWLDRRGYTALPALWGQDEEGPMRKRPKKPKPPKRKAAGGGRGTKGGKNGKRNTIRKRPAAWSAEMAATLRALWATWTAGELCKLTGLTRSAIIGKAWRLKLPRKKPSGNGKPKPQRVGPRIRPPVYYVPMLPPPVIELDFLGLSIDEIQSYRVPLSAWRRGRADYVLRAAGGAWVELLSLPPQTMLPCGRRRGAINTMTL